ncbi:hypothetical protein Bca52824_074242 [Brassica carinata]|uniref:Uncharacterized protein n=1 Tax=Brassica carinata TaxID=52824 RepID=A0A8X7QCS7_BRACI|nr:hypothetical protein Bca52824_074242 [Brassica carinata]
MDTFLSAKPLDQSLNIISSDMAWIQQVTGDLYDPCPVHQSHCLHRSQDAGSNFLLRISDGVSHPRAQMDPTKERRDRKRQQEYFNMLGNVAILSEFGRCPYGGRIIDEVRVKEEYDTLPGKRFFTCINYEVIGVQEEMECLRKRVEEAEQVIKWVPNLNKQIESVEVKRLTLLLDNLTSDVYNLTVQVADLEKVCFE